MSTAGHGQNLQCSSKGGWLTDGFLQEMLVFYQEKWDSLRKNQI
jgi:hypothetical protein